MPQPRSYVVRRRLSEARICLSLPCGAIVRSYPSIRYPSYLSLSIVVGSTYTTQLHLAATRLTMPEWNYFRYLTWVNIQYSQHVLTGKNSCSEPREGATLGSQSGVGAVTASTASSQGRRPAQNRLVRAVGAASQSGPASRVPSRHRR